MTRGRRGLLSFLAVVLAAVLLTRPAAGDLAGGLGILVNPTYIADGSTRLFDAFDGSMLGDSSGVGITYAEGYLGGQALSLNETGATVSYADTWWASGDEGYQDSGTIELYFRADSFVYDGDHPYGVLLSTDERATNPGAGGYPTLAIAENGGLSWAVSTGLGGYHEALYSSDPPLYPKQWYHIAATWGAGRIRLYINDTEVASSNSDTVIRARSFSIGASGTDAFAQGLAPLGRVDRLRISAGAREAGSFPVALSVVIDSPVGGENLLRPFPITYRTFSSDSRARVVSLYADTDGEGFDGILVARDLPDSGTYLLGGGLPDGNYQLYAVARAGSDSAWYQYANTSSVSANPLIPLLADPAETAATVAVPVQGSETFLTLLLNGGGTTSGTLLSAANSSGAGANYSVTSRLANAGDTAVFHVWTRLAASGMQLGLRSDTTSITGPLPRGIAATPEALTAFGRTMVFVEFLDANGRMIGDTRTTSRLAETFVYSIVYRLSKSTTGLYRVLGFDTTVGSSSFAFFYADTIGAAWIEDTTVTVTVTAGTLAGGINVTVTGLARDLPGGLGMSGVVGSGATSTVRASSGCLLTESGIPERVLAAARGVRDALLFSPWMRWLTALYYAFSGACTV